jgi:hypothetical protein
MTRKYAEGTSVPMTRSREEIEKRLRAQGATSFGYADEGKREGLYFVIEKRHVRIEISKPYKKRWDGAPTNEIDDAEHRRRWRAMLLIVKAKLEAVASGISTIEREFLADIVMPDGSTVGAWLQPQIADVYANGKMPRLLSAPREVEP